MHTIIPHFIVYRDLVNDPILTKMSNIFKNYNNNLDRELLVNDIYDVINDLLEISTRFGFNNNLWQCYICYLILTTENPYTLVTEKVGYKEGSINEFVLHDISLFKKLLNYDFSKIEKDLNINVFDTITNYQSIGKNSNIYNTEVSEKVLSLLNDISDKEDVHTIFNTITQYYQKYGVGFFGLNKAFRLSDHLDNEFLIPITNCLDVHLEDLVGYELQKKKLIDNTEAFINGRNANNVLLFGDAGTGKSTSIKAILNKYYDDGLRIIEVYKHQFKYLSKIISTIKNRNYRFIIFMDDLSFEEFETDYKYLKAIIEGGLEPKPENVLIYATSNRRHLIREVWSDREGNGEDINRNDTIQEKISLSARFGVQIGYFKPTKKEFLEIVSTLSKKYPEITISEDELLIEANKWMMRNGGTSGRVAQQFIDYIVGTYIK